MLISIMGQKKNTKYKYEHKSNMQPYCPNTNEKDRINYYRKSSLSYYDRHSGFYDPSSDAEEPVVPHQEFKTENSTIT